MQSVAKLKSLDQLQNWVINVLTGVNDILMHDSFSRKKDVVDEAKEYMRQNLEKNISLNEISEKFFVNPYYFSQLFKKKTGTNYQKYLTSLRVERAQKLLKETNLKIYEIAQMVGYADVTYFSKLFERTTGVKPSEFRGQNE